MTKGDLWDRSNRSSFVTNGIDPIKYLRKRKSSGNISENGPIGFGIDPIGLLRPHKVPEELIRKNL